MPGIVAAFPEDSGGIFPFLAFDGFRRFQQALTKSIGSFVLESGDDITVDPHFVSAPPHRGFRIVWTHVDDCDHRIKMENK